MGDECALRPGLCIKFKGNVVGIQASAAVGDQCPQRVVAHDAVHFFGTGFCKVGRNVHRWLSGTERVGAVATVADNRHIGKNQIAIVRRVHFDHEAWQLRSVTAT